MTSHLRLSLASLALLATVAARAEPSPARSGPNRPLGLIVSVLDSDHDGNLSAREIAAAPNILAALDSNQDGRISAEERRGTQAQGRPVRGSRGPGAAYVVLALDANQDGDIQTMEIANAVSSLKRLDLNGDGQLTRDELQPVAATYHRA